MVHPAHTVSTAGRIKCCELDSEPHLQAHAQKTIYIAYRRETRINRDVIGRMPQSDCCAAQQEPTWDLDQGDETGVGLRATNWAYALARGIVRHTLRSDEAAPLISQDQKGNPRRRICVNFHNRLLGGCYVMLPPSASRQPWRDNRRLLNKLTQEYDTTPLHARSTRNVEGTIPLPIA
jgi:hypothetical protein